MSRYPIYLATFASFVLAGCSSESDTESAQEPDAVSTISSSGSVAPSPALSDPTIVAIFDAANTADIETGQLAVERGSSKEVRDFGAMLVRDHQMVRQQGRDLANRLGVTPTPPEDDASARAHADVMSTLRSKEGAEFDRAFLAHEVKFHRDVIDAVRTTLLPMIENGELRAFVVMVAPAFEAHMIAAQNLEKQLAREITPTDRLDRGSAQTPQEVEA